MIGILEIVFTASQLSTLHFRSVAERLAWFSNVDRFEKDMQATPLH